MSEIIPVQGRYGERKVQEAIAAAPTVTPPARPVSLQGAPPASSPSAGPPNLQDVFAPTERPGESPTAIPDQDIEEVTRARLWAIYLETRSPWLLRYLQTD
ncbi:MAG: hypothetical protein M3O70_02495 [Actinomycetota bacterium]|nr:hypothetical protein [Actinomycetota bacterium]